MWTRARALHWGMALAAALWAAAAGAAELKLLPVDEAAGNPSFMAFRGSLLDAVRRRDAEYVVARAAPDIRLSFGGQYGREMLLLSLTGEEDWEGERYWTELQHVLELGGVFLSDGAFCAPYVSCVEVPNCMECDPFETVFVTSAYAVAHAKPELGGEIAARLSYDILMLNPDKPYQGDWIPVLLPGGGAGYVKGPEFRFVTDYRARFEKQAEGWLMTVFISGD